jgi:tetratricopeptide (TPR) repeat protein
MNVGKNHYEQSQTDKAIEAFVKATAMQPANSEAFLNLANAYLLAGEAQKSLQTAREAINLDPNSAAARYVAGSAALRLSQYTNAIQYLQECMDIDIKVNTVSFQLGRAHQAVGHFEEAAELFRSVIEWEPEHQSAHYLLSQVLSRLGRKDDAQEEAKKHAEILAKNPIRDTNPSIFERCVYTAVKAPFILEQPDDKGIKVAFTDFTAAALGASHENFHPPVGVFDINQRGVNDLLLREGTNGFRLLLNSNGVFHPTSQTIPLFPNAHYTRCLVGDLNNDRYQDAALFSDKGIQMLKFATNGMMTDATAMAGMKQRVGLDGVLADMDLTSKLDMIVLSPTNHEPLFLRNLGPMYFKDTTATSGIPVSLKGLKQIAPDDWNGDGLIDLFFVTSNAPPQLFIKQRGSQLAPTNPPSAWPVADVIAIGDLNNDFRNDIVFATSNKIEIRFQGVTNTVSLSLSNWPVAVLKLWDYDNDGWLDIAAAGKGVRLWRNLGQNGFRETTHETTLDTLNPGIISSMNVADLDQDGDSDLVLGTEGGAVCLWRNEGANANHMLKLRLVGNRSNASGIGSRVEVNAVSWHVLRTVNELPVEIGLGAHAKPDSVKVHWSDLSLPVTFELTADPKTVWDVMEIDLPPGSCPYLYAWDGNRFRFVTDILGASPMGLRVSANQFVDADTEELVSIGDEKQFQPLKNEFLLQVTSELREVLFLDEAKLAAVDYPPNMEVHSTSKMLPGKPYPRSEIMAVHHRYPLRKAIRSDGQDVTSLLQENDRQMVSPIKLRIPQLRGLAEPFQLTLDFGTLPNDRPLILALSGWLRFGGGMANIAASHDPDLPFPFPILEAKLADGSWKPVDVTVGVPCGKTKTILVDLTGKLPSNTQLLRLSMAYELHWDRIALFEKADHSQLRITTVAPKRTHLHWRGYGVFEDNPWYIPLTPRYDKVDPNPKWRITPTGWCTRYGIVDELVAKRDDALVLINGGDELTLAFDASSFPSKKEPMNRAFFFYSVGWEKDSDFHVELGCQVEPLPFHGMDDQQYGRQQRPVIDGDWWIPKYNTRWVGPTIITRANSK